MAKQLTEPKQAAKLIAEFEKIVHIRSLAVPCALKQAKDTKELYKFGTIQRNYWEEVIKEINKIK